MVVMLLIHEYRVDKLRLPELFQLITELPFKIFLRYYKVVPLDVILK